MDPRRHSWIYQAAGVLQLSRGLLGVPTYKTRSLEVAGRRAQAASPCTNLKRKKIKRTKWRLNPNKVEARETAVIGGPALGPWPPYHEKEGEL
ncbi:hypothetical protein CRG98_039818 [Punica granatum]|uniref:Uncharacterized protein n=1 Tax=Punica granatum TaxID=22663 RepID=A0A2I0I7K6_PUNGR|nr:hypothetical protein CRG98_039818 [Punica granatum]